MYISQNGAEPDPLVRRGFYVDVTVRGVEDGREGRPWGSVVLSHLFDVSADNQGPHVIDAVELPGIGWQSSDCPVAIAAVSLPDAMRIGVFTNRPRVELIGSASLIKADTDGSEPFGVRRETMAHDHDTSKPPVMLVSTVRSGWLDPTIHVVDFETGAEGVLDITLVRSMRHELEIPQAVSGLAVVHVPVLPQRF